jgi:hypothetical protein
MEGFVMAHLLLVPILRLLYCISLKIAGRNDGQRCKPLISGKGVSCGYIVRGISEWETVGYNRGVRVLWARVCFCAVPLLMGLPVSASVVPLASPAVPAPGKISAPSETSDARMMRESLSRDIARHPGDFVVFATEAGAKQFFAEHFNTVEPETNSRVVSRGVMGYWQGKTIVVLPWGPLTNVQ